jgi:uncharacterized protein (TIGR03435 family)
MSIGIQRISLLAIGLGLTLAAQQPSFEVASVKHVGSAIMYGPGVSPVMGCRYNGTKVTCRQQLRSLVEHAYTVEPWQVQGPDWIDTENYEVAATMPEGASRETGRLMMRTLLAERFGLKFHTEQKEFPVYALVVAKSGLKLKEIEKPDRFGYGIKTGHTEGTMRFETVPGIPMSTLATFLQTAAGRPVLDQTERPGYYNFDPVEWTRDPADRTNTGMIAALAKAGLKLEPQKKMYDVLVIEKASKEPTEN